MLTMSEINSIKFFRNHKSFSINKIANTFGINWRTAKKYADKDEIPREKKTLKKGMMYQEKWGEIVSDWLMEDQKLRRKQRRTKKKIYEDLKSMGFPGSYRTVCYFIEEWKEGKIADEETSSKNYERLQHPPGEAQVDFGKTEAVKDGKYIDSHCLVMTLPYSNAAFCVALPGENQECFLYGLKTLFHQLGGVPRKLRIDNLTAAVIQARSQSGEAQFTQEFLQFANFYGFEVQPCNPRSGHEKGNVENKVGYIRYNFVTPAPVVKSYEHLTEILSAKLTKDRERKHYQKQVPIQELLQEEEKHLLALPEEGYPVFKEKIVKANKYGEITLDKTKVYIPRGYSYGQLHLVLYWNRFKVVSPDGEILYEDERPYMHSKRNIPWKSILTDWARKPRCVTYSRYAPYLPGRVYQYISIENYQLRKDRIKWLISLLASYDMEEINERFYELIQEREFQQVEDHPYDVNWEIYDQLNHITKGEDSLE